jgi:integrase
MATRNVNGTGTLRERPPGSNRWQLRAFAGTDRTTGRPRQVSKTFVGNAAAAERALRSFVSEVETGKLDRIRATVDQLLDQWLGQIEPTHRPKTVHEYRRWIDARIRPTLGDVRLNRLGADRLDGQYRMWLAEGLSESSVHHLHAILSAALNQAVKWGWLEASPASRASPPPLRSKVPVTPTPEQMARLYAEANRTDPTLATAIALAALTGVRRGELCALRWSDIDLTVGCIRIARSLTIVNKQIHEGPTKTHQVRDIALDENGVALLRARWAYMLDLSERAESPLVADPYVLSGAAHGGHPADPDKITGHFAALCAKLEAEARKGAPTARNEPAVTRKWPFRFHDLRHFSVTTLIAAGVDVRTVAERHGHAQPTMTLNRYAHALPERDRAAAAILGKAFGSATTGPDVERVG